MTKLTELQARCLGILQRRAIANDNAGSKLGSIAWEMDRTAPQASDCLGRLRRKGLVSHVGASLYSLTAEGLTYQNDLPPDE